MQKPKRPDHILDYPENTIETFNHMRNMVLQHRKKDCIYDDCERPREIREYCEMHYARLKRRGLIKPNKSFIKPAKTHEFLVDLFDSEPVSECISWPFGHTVGYGHFKYKNILYRVHRLVCEVKNGEPPFDKPNAAHECGNSICCNPLHLTWKSQKDNIADKEKHGTKLIGERHHQAKLTETQVIEIRSLRNKISRSKLAVMFGCTRSCIDEIIDRKTWRHLA